MSSLRQDTSKPPIGFLEDYAIDDNIGHGSFATVFRALHKPTGRWVAIKTILSAKLNPRLIKSIEFEIRILQEMKHPNITELYEIKRTESKVCLVMELCAFGDLSEYIKKHRLKPGTGGNAGGLSEVIFRHFLLQLAFKFLRGKDLVHRDLKPQLKVADFGFAKILPSQALTETACGSPLYMAPEVLKKNKYTASADLWSIGAVLYEMITGRAPFRASDHKELQNKIELGGDHIWFPGEPTNIINSPQLQELGEAASSFAIDENLVSADIKALIRGLLVRDPGKRISFEAFFAHPAVRSFEAPPRPVLPKPKPSLQQFALQNAQNKLNDAGMPPLEKDQPRPVKDASFEERHPLKKATSLKSLNGQFRPEEPSSRRASLHIRSHSASNPMHTGAAQAKANEDDTFDKDYILIGSEFDQLRLNKGVQASRKRSPLNLHPTQTSGSHLQASRKGLQDPGFDVLPSPKSLPKSLLGEPNKAEWTSQDKGSPPSFRADSASDGLGPGSGDGGWRVGSGAASALASAISKATTKLFGARGLSPPAAQYRSDAADPVAFPLEGPSASDKEEEVLKRMETVACQAYALTKFADHKLDDMKRHSAPLDTKAELEGDEGETALGTTCQDAFLLYAKALGLLYVGFDNVSAYWSEVSRSHQGVVSPRLSKAARWLQDKTNECLEKAEMVQNKMAERSFAITTYDTDLLIYNYALNSCQDGVFKEIKGERILESEFDYLMGLWMLQAIMFRAPQDLPLTTEDAANIRQMMTMVEDRLLNFRKTLDELDLRQYALGHAYLPYHEDGPPNRP
ncbi:Serine/threonine-protein kinase [Massospora cicadina]|nr:Serine/threonine-protein kinase [Massospora cicadina]